jgi:hypothetical protein
MMLLSSKVRICGPRDQEVKVEVFSPTNIYKYPLKNVCFLLLVILSSAGQKILVPMGRNFNQKPNNESVELESKMPFGHPYANEPTNQKTIY